MGPWKLKTNCREAPGRSWNRGGGGGCFPARELAGGGGLIGEKEGAEVNLWVGLEGAGAACGVPATESSGWRRVWATACKDHRGV